MNGDGIISPLDRVVIGNTIPAFTYTLGFDCSYKDFDFNIYLFGVGGFDIYNYQNQL